ncbi:MAG: histidine ammonia-lyase [Bdellovibrionaceae bacterium]|nr:histidine ammonia-lyase [Pseudobdellovibrionaceae bacterium]MDW8190639.1 histidine ammonia-lyase [Pseudobdellovibrionaceae bacterium]
METLRVLGHSLSPEQVWNVSQNTCRVSLDHSAREKMTHSRQFILNKMQQGDIIYGVNTGFGAFSSVRISAEQITQLQINLIRSHAVGVGQPFSRQEVRAIMLLRAATLANGHSGVRPEVVEKILEFLNHDIVPYVPSQGSVGASGDLAPLAHIALALMGEGDALSKDGQRIPIAPLLTAANVAPLKLEAKEGLSLINGCQVMTAVGLLQLRKGQNLVRSADIIGALSLEALRGSRKAFDPLISAVRPHPGEIQTASNLRLLLGETSEIGQSHLHCDRVQDAYSLRCIPTVHGTVRSALEYLEKVLVTEANSATDNPLVFPEANKILSCGNFHGMPVALALDFACMALTTLGSISEQRLAKLINPAMSYGLPAFLIPEGGLNSGHMMTHVTAASLVSENKVLSHPACVDSIPTSADKEDHVSMGTIAACKLARVTSNVTQILANELLSAAQAIDLLRPLRTSPALEAAHQLVRKHVPFAQHDRPFGRDCEILKHLIESEELAQTVQMVIPLP